MLEVRQYHRSSGTSKGKAMANRITVQGFVSSDFEMSTTQKGVAMGKFRMGSADSIKDPITNTWGDGPTNWYRVTTFRSLAANSVVSLRKGDRIIVVGRLNIRTYLRPDGTKGTSVEIEADSIGPDLKFGSAHFTRMVSAHPVAAPDESRGFNAPASEGRQAPGYLPGEDPEGETDDLDDADHDLAAALTNDDPQDTSDEEDSDDDEVLESGESVDSETGEISESVPY
ncbi:single-stranded DNA-binding protein [Arthrobacter psychrolactophilus]|nr:single-stranded DNA-binding protein [Arthrobacter psychrolactophilus]